MLPVWTGGASGIDGRELMVPFSDGGAICVEELGWRACEEEPEALYWYARVFLGETWLDYDPEEAAGMLGEAAGRGHPEAMALLGELMVRGLGVEKDEPGGLRLAREAADRGARMGLRWLRSQFPLLRGGSDGGPDPSGETGGEWRAEDGRDGATGTTAGGTGGPGETAATEGVAGDPGPDREPDLDDWGAGYVYPVPVWTGGASGTDERGRMVPFWGGRRIRIDELEGRVRAGHAEAMYWLAKLFLGEGSSDEDPKKAAVLLEAAANQGYPEALSLLGELMVRGYGTEKDESEGFRLMEEAVDRGGWNVLGPAAPGSPPPGLEEELARRRRIRRDGSTEEGVVRRDRASPPGRAEGTPARPADAAAGRDG